MNALARLIDHHRTSQRMSYADIAERAGMPKSTVHSLATTRQWKSPPSVEVLDKLAGGLRLPTAVVRRAASVAAGLTQETGGDDDPGLFLLVETIRTLPKRQRDQVWALVQQMAAPAEH